MGWCTLTEEKGEQVIAHLDEDRVYQVKDKTLDARSFKQNNSIHLYCKFVADALNEVGITQEKYIMMHKEQVINYEFDKLFRVYKTIHNFISKIQDTYDKLFNRSKTFANNLYEAKTNIIEASSEVAELNWTMIAVKEIIWREIQIPLTKKHSTTKLTSEEVTLVYREVDNFLSSRTGLPSIDFPSQESMMREQNKDYYERGR